MVRLLLNHPTRSDMRFFNFLKVPVVQFSPPRTGSTLVWNVLREIFPGRKIKKKHTLRKRQLGPFPMPVVCTVRHPMDALASCIQCRELEHNDQTITDLMDEFDRLAIRRVLEIKDDPHVLILRYEEFAGNYDFLFNELETFFQLRIESGLRQMIRQKYDVKKIKEKTRALGGFENWTKQDHLHGRHVSEKNGACGYYKTFFSPEQIDRMAAHYQNYMKEFGYSV